MLEPAYVERDSGGGNDDESLNVIPLVVDVIDCDDNDDNSCLLIVIMCLFL